MAMGVPMCIGAQIAMMMMSCHEEGSTRQQSWESLTPFLCYSPAKQHSGLFIQT